jgi:hypothetical protein
MAKKKTDIRLVVVFSDLHSGSRRALMPPKYELFEEGKPGGRSGQVILANPQQLWLYDCWCRGWEKVIKYVGGDPWAWACVGDAIEGIHHGLTELVSNDPTDHMIIFDQCNRPYAELAAKRFMVRGTRTHTSDTVEMKLGEKLKCERHPDTGQWASDRWILDINGYKLLLRHHMETTSREWLRIGALNRELDNEILAAAKRGQPQPDGAVMAHRHMYDSMTNGKNFAMVCGPWQQTTRHGHTKWSAMLPQPTITVLDWREAQSGGPPIEKTFQFTPPAAKVHKL